MRGGGWSLTALLTLALGLIGCGGDEPVGLVIDLQTDYAPGRDFVSIETGFSVDAFEREEERAAEHESRRATVDDDGLAGIRVAQFYGLPQGPGYVRVQLVAANGLVIGSRIVSLDLGRDDRVTVVVSHACATRSCEGRGLTECTGGVCVDTSCSPEHPDRCGDAICESDSDCRAPDVSCARAMCRDGFCFAERMDNVCPGGEVCDLSRGCGETCEANETICYDGIDEDCDGETDCDDRDCVSSACDDGFWCNGERDTCGRDGECSVHADPPCEAYCIESERACEACATDGDCGEVSAEPWAACEGFTAACDDTGTQTRTVSTPVCRDGACDVELTTETQDCSRPALACCPERSCPSTLSDAVGMARTPTGDGYWLLGRGGTLVPFGDARCCMGPSTAPDGRAEAIEMDPSGYGFYTLGIGAGIFTYGEASIHGGGSLGLASDMTADRDGSGYWIVNLIGDTRALAADELDDLVDRAVTLAPGVEIVGLAAEQTSVQRGAWMVANDCTVHSAPKRGMVLPLHGSPRSSGVTSDCVHIAAHPSCSGYWVVGGDGAVYAFGCAVHQGDASTMSADDIVHIEATPSGDGYWLVGEDGSVFAFGDAVFHGAA